MNSNDDDWNKALAEATCKLPADDVRWLSEGENQQPFTSAKLLEKLQPALSESKHGILRSFFMKIDGLLSHIESFTVVLGTFAQADPTGAGLIWASVLLLVQACCTSSTHRI